MDDLVTFLRARLDEDAAAAKDERYVWPANFEVTLNPARVLREVEAGRKLLAAYDAAVNGPSADLAVADALEAVIRDWAAVYSDHPDYRPEWKP